MREEGLRNGEEYSEGKVIMDEGPAQRLGLASFPEGFKLTLHILPHLLYSSYLQFPKLFTLLISGFDLDLYLIAWV